MTDPPAEETRSARETVTLSLVSHTNVGKTTLARTLLRRDVGEVLDQAHVTETAEMWVLVSTAESELRLWDTPGFGDSARLLRRLRTEERPVLWFVQQWWDRVTDRPFWCSQQAVLNVRDEADVVLYLLNGLEDPLEAGYVGPELDLIAWLGRPVLALVNQTGEEAQGRVEREARLRAWRDHLLPREAVRDVLPLDAFCRSWIQEDALMQSLAGVLEGPKAEAMRRLASAWHDRNEETFRRSCRAVAAFLSRAVVDHETMVSRRPSRDEKAAALEHLARRLEAATRDLTESLLTFHGLAGREEPELERALDGIVIRDEDLLDEERSALWGGVVSGAVGGLAADLLAGGLTFGGGMLAGAILGALGGAGLAKGVRWVRGDKRPALAWSGVFLEQLVASALIRYLAIATFGRGRGEYRGAGEAARWRTPVEEEIRKGAEAWRELLGEGAADRESRLEARVAEALRAVLARETGSGV